MRNEFIETEEIEKYLLRRLNADEQKQFELNMLLDPSLAEKTEAQAGVHKIVRRFWRMQTRKSLEHIFQQLLQETSFEQQLQ